MFQPQSARMRDSPPRLLCKVNQTVWEIVNYSEHHHIGSLSNTTSTSSLQSVRCFKGRLSSTTAGMRGYRLHGMDTTAEIEFWSCL